MRFLANFRCSTDVVSMKKGLLTMNFRLSRKVFIVGFALTLGLSAASCSRKSGCPAEDAQTQVDKRGNYKKSKTTSGLGLVPKKGSKKSRSN